MTTEQEEGIRIRMGWAVPVADAIGACMGEVKNIHTALPPMSLGGSGASVAVSHQPDGTVRYTTIGVSTPLHEEPTELMLHAAKPDVRLVELMSVLGRECFYGRLGLGHTIPLAAPDQSAVFHAIGIMMNSMETPVEGRTLGFVQIVALDETMLATARSSGMAHVEQLMDAREGGRIAHPLGA